MIKKAQNNKIVILAGMGIFGLIGMQTVLMSFAAGFGGDIEAADPGAVFYDTQQFSDPDASNQKYVQFGPVYSETSSDEEQDQDAEDSSDSNTQDGSDSGSAGRNTFEGIIDDNWIGDEGKIPHLVKPHGVPDSFDWANFAKKDRPQPPSDFTSGTAWGQIYLAEGSAISENVRVRLSDFRAYLLMKDGAWDLVQSSVFGGNFFENAFTDNNSSASEGDVRELGDRIIEVRLDSMNHNYHYWMNPRMSYSNADDVVGIYVRVDAQLRKDDPNGVNNLDTAKLIMNVGADWWRTPSAEYVNPAGTNNPATGVGRFRTVTAEKAAFHFTTVKPGVLRDNPPPLE